MDRALLISQVVTMLDNWRRLVTWLYMYLRFVPKIVSRISIIMDVGLRKHVQRFVMDSKDAFIDW